MKVRRGYSLIEMVTVISLLGVVLGLVGSTLTTIHQLDSSVRREIAADDALLALESQLRRDVHVCRSARVAAPDLYLELSDGRFLLWTISRAEISRELVSQGDVQQREAWPLPKGYDAAWSDEQQGAAPWVVLSASSSDPGSRHIEFRSAVGRFRALAEGSP